MFKKRITWNTNLVEKINTFSLKGKNVFFGYYDINPLKNHKLLCHVVKKYADTAKDQVEIGYFDTNTQKYTKLTQSEAWCWQQGSRLRWSKEDHVIIYNDIYQNKYCAKYFDIQTKKVIKTISYPLYDINQDETYGVSINFSRLQRLRPGYGYDKLPDISESDFYPQDDGLFLVDLKRNTSKLTLSLYDLAKDVPNYSSYQHYINHVSFAPNGKKFMFFHLYTQSTTSDWKVRLCVYDISKSQLQVLEEMANASHYDWIDNDHLLVTTFTKNPENHDYRIYSLKENNYIMLDNDHLKLDGHPTYYHHDQFISDTYPDDYFFQHLFQFNIKNASYEKILSIFSNPRLMYDQRCDLHPRIVPDGIIIDSTYKGNKRNLVYIQLKEGFYDKSQL